MAARFVFRNRRTGRLASRRGWRISLAAKRRGQTQNVFRTKIRLPRKPPKRRPPAPPAAPPLPPPPPPSRQLKWFLITEKYSTLRDPEKRRLNLMTVDLLVTASPQATPDQLLRIAAARMSKDNRWMVNVLRGAQARGELRVEQGPSATPLTEGKVFIRSIERDEETLEWTGKLPPPPEEE